MWFHCIYLMQRIANHTRCGGPKELNLLYFKVYNNPITGLMKSTKVQNPRRILHISRSMPMRVHRACAGLGQKIYACALLIIDGLGHATWSSKMPVSRSGTAPF